MSQLRADITYNHWLQSNSTINKDIYDIFERQSTFKEPEPEPEPEAEAEASTSNTTQEQDFFETTMVDEHSDEELDNVSFEGDFSNYLQGWADMLKEEQRFEREETEEEASSIENITHPAIDKHAKWELISLFKELVLPF